MGDLYRGSVSRVDAAGGVFVEVPQLAAEREFGPLEVVADLELMAPGVRVLVASVGSVADDVVVLGVTVPAVTPMAPGGALDANVVHKTGDETIAGLKQFDGPINLRNPGNVLSGGLRASEAGVPDPTVAPTVSSTYDNTTFSVAGITTALRGLGQCFGDKWVTAIADAGGARLLFISKINFAVESFALPAGFGATGGATADSNGVCYVLGKDSNRANAWFVYRYGYAAGVGISKLDEFPVTLTALHATAQPVIGCTEKGDITIAWLTTTPVLKVGTWRAPRTGENFDAGDLHPDPAVAGTSWASNASFGSYNVGTVTVGSGDPVEDRFARLTAPVDNGLGTNIIRPYAVAAGVVTWLARVKATAGLVITPISLFFANGASVVATGNWQTVRVTYTAAAGNPFFGVVAKDPDGTGPTGGSTIDVARPILYSGVKLDYDPGQVPISPTSALQETVDCGAWPATTDLSSAQRTKGVDFAAARYVVSSQLGGIARVFSRAGARQTAEEWPLPDNRVDGMFYDNFAFRQLRLEPGVGGKVFLMTPNSGSTDFSYTYGDNDPLGLGLAETKKATNYTVTPTRFATWNLIAPAAPPDDGSVDAANVTYAYAAAAGGTLIKQGFAEAATVAIRAKLLTVGDQPPPVSGFSLRPGTLGRYYAGKVDADGPLWEFPGGGDLRAGPWKSDSTGLPLRSAYPSATGVPGSPLLGEARWSTLLRCTIIWDGTVWVTRGTTSGRVVAATNLTLSGTQTIDSVACVAGDVVLCRGQSTLANNGPWVVDASTWTRPRGFDTSAAVNQSSPMRIREGSFAGCSFGLAVTTLGTTEFSSRLLTSPDDADIVKPSDEGVTNSTVLQNDDHLLFAVKAGRTYAFEIHLFYAAANNNVDIQVTLTAPAGTLLAGVQGLDGTTTSVTGSLIDTSIVASGGGPVILGNPATTVVHGRIKGTFIATADGTVQLQWCQNFSSGNTMTVKAGSTLTARRVA